MNIQHAFAANAFSPDAFDDLFGYDTFPESSANPDLMQILGYTPTQTMLWDYSGSEVFYLLVSPPEVTTKTLFAISSSFARQWFMLGGGNGLRILYNPFFNVVS